MIVGLVATGRGVAVSVRRDDTLEEFIHFHEEIAPTRKVIKTMEIENCYSETFHVSMKDIEDAMKAQRKREIEEQIARLQAELETY